MAKRLILGSGVWLAAAIAVVLAGGCSPNDGDAARATLAAGAGATVAATGVSGRAGSASGAGASPTLNAGGGGAMGMLPPNGAAGIAAPAAGRAGMMAAAGRAGMTALPMSDMAGMTGAAGRAGQAGLAGRPTGPTAGTGTAGMTAAGGGAAGSGGMPAAGSGETGRLVGMTAAHNAVRAMVQTTPALAPMTWSPTLAAYAQQWADMLAMNPSTCDRPGHRTGQELSKVGYGENLAAFGSRPTPPMSTAKQAVDGWAAEVKCWTFGTVLGTEKCEMKCYWDELHSDGCGHYTQIVWRTSTQLGCGVASCKATDGSLWDIWICNYAAAGNIVGKAPY